MSATPETNLPNSGNTDPILFGPGRIVLHELQELRKHWWCLFLLGLTLIICGSTAMMYPMFASVGVTIAIGIALLISGVGMVVMSFWTRAWRAFLIQLLVGILYVVAGLSMTESPVTSAAALTLLLASFAVVGGLFRAVAALTIQFPQWGWVLLSGIISLIFGVVVLRHFPAAGLVLIGIMVGVDMLFTGLSWLMLSLEVRSIPESPTAKL